MQSIVTLTVQSREITESRRHKFGLSELDTNPPLDGRRRHAQFGKVDEIACVWNPSVSAIGLCDQGTLQRSARLATNYLDQFTRGNAADNVVVSANSLTIADVPNNGTVLGLLVRIISRQIVTHYFKSPLVTT